MLISAPAGAGKTTLLSTWLAAQSRPAAWLGLDPYDTDFGVFVRYFVTAVQTVHASFGTAALALFHLPQLPPVDYLAATLLDELAGLPDACIVALDDYDVELARMLEGGWRDLRTWREGSFSLTLREAR